MTELEATAYHESGHAVVGTVLHFPTRAVGILPSSRSLGKHTLAVPISRFEVADVATWLLAGTQSEQWFCRGRDPRLIRRNAAGDDALLRQLLEATRQADQDVDALVAQYEVRAMALVAVHESWIANVARRLLTDKILDDDMVRDLRPA